MWGGITVLLPYELYRRHGDLRMLQDAYPTIKGYLAFMAHFSNTTDGLVHPQGFVSNHLTSQLQLTSGLTTLCSFSNRIVCCRLGFVASRLTNRMCVDVATCRTGLEIGRRHTAAATATTRTFTTTPTSSTRSKGVRKLCRQLATRPSHPVQMGPASQLQRNALVPPCIVSSSAPAQAATARHHRPRHRRGKDTRRWRWLRAWSRPR